MKYIFLILFGFAAGVSFSQISPEIQDANAIVINKLPERTTFWLSPTLKEAKKADYDHSVWDKSLNGKWNFHWSPDPQSRPVEFYRTEYVLHGWATIDVPSTIEKTGTCGIKT